MAFATTKAPSAERILCEKGFLASFWRKIFLTAKELEASDIHIESLKTGLQVRLRVKGTLIESFDRITNRDDAVQLMDKFKELSGLSLTNKSILQDTSFTLESTESTYRVSLSPGFEFGECCVLRIIDNGALPRLEKLNLSHRALTDISWAIDQKQGLFLVTGPTGSGKSTTLQACIAAMDYKEKKIISIENPPERILPGVVHEKITNQYSWADAIKGAMRQDPDVILVGEIRDRDSAKLAIEAAQTGHLVLTTLHTNDAPSTVNRLLTLGIEKHLIADALLFVSAQRLLKRLCNECKIKSDLYYQRLPSGCSACKFTGYSGRVAILEYCLTPDPDLVFNFNVKTFATHLCQDLATETKKLIESGQVDHRIIAQPKG